MEQKNYPDVSPIFAAKEERRRQLAALSWEEKVAIIEKMNQAMPRKKWRSAAPAKMTKTAVDAAIVMPMHDPTGFLFPHLVAITPQLKELFRRAVVSITPVTRAQQLQWVEQLAADDFFRVCEYKTTQPVGDAFVQLYAHAAATCPPDTLLHLCFIDRVAYALQSAHRAQFITDIQGLQPDDAPLIFHRSAAAWQTHPRNYQAIEGMLTKLSESYFQKALDFTWCHLVVPASQLHAILPQVQKHDLSVCAELVLLLRECIQTKEVDWLAWEDPFILGRDAAQLKLEREQSVAETQKRLAYVLPMLQVVHEVMGQL
ncbi:MAG: hypothetical protein R3E79_05920 [Caldilineaceae bacterium]